MAEYIALHKPNQLIYGTGTVAVITGWTPKERVAKLLQSEQYAVVGNLYAPSGVDILVRNLLHNPHITGLLIIEATKQDEVSGAIAHLFRFLDGQVEIPGIAPKDLCRVRCIARSVLNGLDRSLLSDRIGLLSQRKPLGGEPKKYPMPEIQSDVMPSPLYGHRIEGKTIADAWVKILHRIRSGGVLRPTGYDGQWQELIDLTTVVTDEPESFYFPEPNYLPCDRDFVNSYVPSILEDSPPTEVKYTYGYRLRSHFGRDQVEQVVYKLVGEFEATSDRRWWLKSQFGRDQIEQIIRNLTGEDDAVSSDGRRLRSHFGLDQVEQVVHKLAGEIDAASAVMSLWDVRDHIKGGSPCLNQVWVRIVNGELSLTAVLRSNDMFNAWPINAYGLRALQMHVRDRLKTETGTRFTLGPLITLSQSAHLYDHSFAYADDVVQKFYGRQPKTYDDPVGNYLIEVEAEAGLVRVTRMNSSGQAVREYTGISKRELSDAIALDAPAMQPDHAIYLGIQLERAWNSLAIGSTFVQDKEGL